MGIDGIAGDGPLPPPDYSRYLAQERPAPEPAAEDPASGAADRGPEEAPGQAVDILA